MNMFGGLTGENEHKRRIKAFFLERLRDKPDCHVKQYQEEWCTFCAEPKRNCFCFPERKKKR